MARILVIEDEPSIRENMIETLELEGYQAAAAANGRLGVEMARQYRPDLIICDIMMPEMDGYAVLTALREDPLTRTIPFIFASAKAERGSIRQGMSIGADDYLTKPFTPHELLDAIRSRLARHETIATESAKAYDQIKDRLSRLVTHELRTPLAAINTVMEIVNRQITQLEPHELQDLLGTMSAGSRRLSRVVDQFVFMTHLETGALSVEAVQQAQFARHLWELLVAANDVGRRFTPDRGDVNIRLDMRDQTTQVFCEPNSLKHALAEIISNALAFSPNGSQIEVAQWYEGGYVWVSIRDYGAGMEPDQIKVALADFGQAHRETRENQGMGLGLPLARGIVEAHGGTLDIQSVTGQGTQVVIGLPAAHGKR